MKPLSRRLEALEAKAGDNLDHLSDQEIDERVAAIVSDMRRQGISIPAIWQGAYHANPGAFALSIRLQVEAML
jgi:hypothetical protein